MSALERVHEARRKQRLALAAYHKLAESTFREGDRVQVSLGLGSYWATVARWPGGGGECAYGDSVWVTGESGKGYRVDAARIEVLLRRKGTAA